jgi:hypothetical protein
MHGVQLLQAAQVFMARTAIQLTGIPRHDFRS